MNSRIISAHELNLVEYCDRFASIPQISWCLLIFSSPPVAAKSQSLISSAQEARVYQNLAYLNKKHIPDGYRLIELKQRFTSSELISIIFRFLRIELRFMLEMSPSTSASACVLIIIISRWTILPKFSFGQCTVQFRAYMRCRWAVGTQLNLWRETSLGLESSGRYEYSKFVYFEQIFVFFSSQSKLEQNPLLGYWLEFCIYLQSPLTTKWA